MRKSLFIGLVAILGLLGCSRNQEINIPDANLSILARTESPAETKTVVESGVHVFWEPGDEIAVFTGEKAAKFTTDITAASGTATFKGTFGEETWPEDLDLWAVYPFSEEAVFDGETITTTLPSEQVAREGSFGKDMNLAIAHSSGTTLQFYNLGGGIRFSVQEKGIMRVILEGLRGEMLAGRIGVSFQNGLPVITDSGKIPYIELTAPEGGEFVPGEWYYMTVMPGTLPSGFRLRFIKADSSGFRDFEKQVEIKRGIFGSVQNVDGGVIFYKDDLVDEDIAVIEDLINQCIDAETDVETKRETLESMPSVETVIIEDTETVIRFISGKTVVFPYNFPSIFEEEDGTEATTSLIGQRRTRARIEAKAAYSRNDVAIFNLFSSDPDRTNQNRLVENTKAVFERAGKSVRIYGRDEFTVDNLVKAITDNSIIYISSLGTKGIQMESLDLRGRILTGEPYAKNSETQIKYAGYLNDFTHCEYPFDGISRWTVDIFQLLESIDYHGDLVYLASCYTMSGKNCDKNVIGWDGVNRVGQAYGLIIADYLATWGKSFNDFYSDFSANGVINDPLEKGTRLLYYGSGWKSGGNRSGWVALKSGKRVVLDKPVPGEQNKRTNKYAVKLSYRNDGTIKTDGRTSTYENGNQYLFEYSDLGTNDYYWRSSDPLRFNKDKVSYTVRNLTPGVWRFRSYCREDNGRNDDVNKMDCSYAIFSDKFAANDVQEDYTPSIVTLGSLAGTDDLVLGGAVINRSLAGLETGFQYWKKNAPTNKSTIATSTTYEDYFGAILQIPDLDGEYEFRAFAKDEEGLIGYGDIQSFKYGGGPQQEYAVPEIVDLGLPSGVKWASFNLGATKPEEYGDYYAWGETEPYYEPGYAQSASPVWKPGKDAGYVFESYKWCMGTHRTMTKYCSDPISGYEGFTDDKYVLEPEDDAAHVILGDKWRMPTKEEWDELRNKCTLEWVQQSGVNCLKISSSNGKYIILPAASSRYGTGFTDWGDIGFYWSSTINPDESFFAQSFNFRPGEYYGGVDGSRSYGSSIRPVYGDPITVFHVESISLDKTELELTVGRNANLYATILPKYATNKNVSWSSSNQSVATVSSSGKVEAIAKGTATITVKTEDNGKTATCRVTVKEFTPSYIAPEAIDLGLSVKWGSFNLGATKIQEYGEYFAWGEIEPRTCYDGNIWEEEYGFIKYCTNPQFGADGFTDGKTTLDPEDDAAHMHLGGKWRMPTPDEYKELVNGCSRTWTTMYGVKGILFTSLQSGFENRAIFLPASGFKRYDELECAGTDADYWTSCLYDSWYESDACAFTLYDQSVGGVGRWTGCSIRPVYDDN